MNRNFHNLFSHKNLINLIVFNLFYCHTKNKQYSEIRK